MSIENAVPNNPENKENIKYNVPISFALVDKNQRSTPIDILLGWRSRVTPPLDISKGEAGSSSLSIFKRAGFIVIINLKN